LSAADTVSRAVIFDLDGVLVNTEPLKAEAHAQTVQSLGGSAPALFYAKVMGGAHDEVRRAFMERGGITAAPEAYSALYRENYERLLDERLAVMPGVEPLLKALRGAGCQLSVATSSQPWMVTRVFERTGLAPWFETVVTAADVERHKPAPDCYLLALKRLEAPASHAVVVEDSETGVRSALSAGLPVIAVRHPFNEGHDFQGAWVVDSLEDTAAVTRKIEELTAQHG